jgi:hypothetical protein
MTYVKVAMIADEKLLFVFSRIADIAIVSKRLDPIGYLVVQNWLDD